MAEEVLGFNGELTAAVKVIWHSAKLPLNTITHRHILFSALNREPSIVVNNNNAGITYAHGAENM